MTPQHNDTPLRTAWARYADGACDWAEVQAAQNAMLPRCEAHDTPTSATIAGKPMCARCIQEAGPALRQWLRSMQLVSGGVWQAGE